MPSSRQRARQTLQEAREQSRRDLERLRAPNSTHQDDAPPLFDAGRITLTGIDFYGGVNWDTTTTTNGYSFTTTLQGVKARFNSLMRERPDMTTGVAPAPDKTHGDGAERCGTPDCNRCYPSESDRYMRSDAHYYFHNSDTIQFLYFPYLTPAELAAFQGRKRTRQLMMLHSYLEAGEKMLPEHVAYLNLTANEIVGCTLFAELGLRKCYQAGRDYSWYQPYVSAERLAVIEAEEAVKARQKIEAPLKARALLMSMLPPREQRRFEEHGWFHFKGNETGSVYRHWMHRRVPFYGTTLLMDGNRDTSNELLRMCLHLEGRGYDRLDNAVSVMLAFQTDEASTIAMANLTVEDLPEDHPVRILRLRSEGVAARAQYAENYRLIPEFKMANWRRHSQYLTELMGRAGMDDSALHLFRAYFYTPNPDGSGRADLFFRPGANAAFQRLYNDTTLIFPELAEVLLREGIITPRAAAATIRRPVSRMPRIPTLNLGDLRPVVIDENYWT